VIALLGRCGLERLAEPLRRRTGAEVVVTAYNDVDLVVRERPTLVYVDLFDWSRLLPRVAAALRGRSLPAPSPELSAIVAALEGQPVVYRGLRPPPQGSLSPPDPVLDRALRQLTDLIADQRQLDVAGLWARHGILQDAVRFGPGHGEAELAELGQSRLTGDSAAEVEAHALHGLWWAATRGPRKCVVVDLDDTLIHGKLVDDGFSLFNPAWGEDPGPLPAEQAEQAWWRVRRGLHLALRELQRRGILLALATRNDLALVQRRFRRRRCTSEPAARALSLCLDHDDFVAVEAGFGPKSGMCRRVAERLGIGLDSLVVVDDRAVERAELAQNLPDALCFDATDPLLVERLLCHPELQTWEISAAVPLRAASYRSRALVTDTPTDRLEAFLADLDIHCVVRPATAADLPRVRELFARSHQLVLTSARPRPRDPAGLWVAAARDRLADHGVVAAGCFDGPTDQRRLLAWACSCRVLPHQVASTILWAMRQAEPGAAVSFEDTGRNGAARGLIARSEAGPRPWVRLDT